MNDREDDVPLLLSADELSWTEDGRALLFGTPQGIGSYVLRVRLDPSDPGGRPHRHAGAEFGTVLEGVIWVAAGAMLDRTGARRLPAGSLIYIPPGLPHALWTDGAALLQIHGSAPRGETEFLDVGGVSQAT